MFCINVVVFLKDVIYDEVYDIVMNNLYMRYLVYDENIDDIIGVFYLKYLLVWSKYKEELIINYVLSFLFVNEYNRVEWVLCKMIVL